MQIVMKQNLSDQIRKQIGANPDVNLTIGDLRSEMAHKLLDICEKEVDRHGHLDKYYIVVTADADPIARSIKTNVMVLPYNPMDLPKKYNAATWTEEEISLYPPKLLGSVGFLIDNRKSDAQLLWCLPLDIARDDELVEEGTAAPRIINDSKNMPIIH